MKKLFLVSAIVIILMSAFGDLLILVFQRAELGETIFAVGEKAYGAEKSRPKTVPTYRLPQTTLVFYKQEDAMNSVDNVMETLRTNTTPKGTFWTTQDRVVHVVDKMKYRTVKFVRVQDAKTAEVIGWVMENRIKRIKE